MTTKFKILHLEDTPADAELVERELKKGNIQFEKLVVDNKIAFEKALKDFVPDIVIADHSLPSFDSLEAIRIMKQKGIKIPIILVTATVSDEYAVEVMKAGADDYILKDRLHRLPQAVLNAMEKNSAEQQLHQSETFNKGILSSLSSNIAVIDESGMLIAANKAWNDFGIKNGITSLDRISTGSNYFDVCKRSMASGDILAGQTLHGIQSVFNKEIKTFELEYPCHSLTEQRWFNLSVTKFGEDDSKVVISHQNITQRKIAEQKLQTSESRLKEAQTVANIGSWETDLQTFNIIWSEEHHHIFETDPKTFQVTHEAFYDFIHPEDRDKVKTTFENSFKSQTLNSIEHRIITSNGTLKHVIENWRIFQDDKGHPVRAVGTCQDITERKLVEEEINKLSLVARKTSNAVVISDAEEKIQWVNEAFTRMTGFEINEIIGKKPGTFLQGPETDPVVVRYMLNKIRNKQAFECDIINYSKSGHKYWTRIQCQPEFDFTGKLTGFFSIQTDITKSKEAEQAIFKLTERLTLATSSAKIGIWEWDVVNNHLIWDKIMYQIFGVAEDKFSGVFEAWAANVHPDDIAKANEDVQSALRDDTKFDSEFRIILPDKSIRYIKGDAIVVRDDTGKPLRMIGTNLDITERKIADEKNRFKANLLNTIGQAAIATDLDGAVNYWNKAAENIYGWAPGEAIGKNIIHLTPTHATREHALEIMDDLKNGRSWSGEFRVQRKDGSNFPALVTNSPIYDENNKLTGIIGISSDITEKKRLEALLDKSNRLARIGSWEIDVDKGTVFWSDITKEIREAEPDFVPDLSTGIGSFIEGTSRKTITQRVQQCIDKGIPWDEELQITTFKGNVKWVRTIGEAEFVHGKCSKVYGSFQDISERKKAESERVKMISDIVQRNSDLEQFSFIVSHNLRAPVANILGLADLIGKDDYTQEVKNNFLEALLENVKRLDIVISDLNSILQVKVAMDSKKETVILNDLVDSIKGSIQNLIEKEKVKITTHFDVPAIHTVQSYLHSIFYNLIANSIKYRQPGIPTQIEIRSESKEGFVVLTFKDNGLGIDLVKKRDQVFGLYKRFHHHIEGKGMGLFLVKTQVQLLGGKISIDSEVNAGTKFTITIKEKTFK